MKEKAKSNNVVHQEISPFDLKRQRYLKDLKSKSKMSRTSFSRYFEKHQISLYLSPIQNSIKVNRGLNFGKLPFGQGRNTHLEVADLFPFCSVVQEKSLK